MSRHKATNKRQLFMNIYSDAIAIIQIVQNFTNQTYALEQLDKKNIQTNRSLNIWLRKCRFPGVL